jgi:hypothetical protein
MNDDKLVKRTFRIAVVIDGAKKEFQEGMGVGVIGYQDVTFNLPAKKYDTPMFRMGLEEQKRQIALAFVSTTVTEVK